MPEILYYLVFQIKKKKNLTVHNILHQRRMRSIGNGSFLKIYKYYFWINWVPNLVLYQR